MIPYLCPELAIALTEVFAPKAGRNKFQARKDRMQMFKTYHDHDADLSLIQQNNAAIIGYASQGRSMRAPLANADHSQMFDVWFSRSLAVLHSTACRVLGGPEEADLAINNCRVAASCNTPSFVSEGAFRSWLLRVLIDEALTIRGQVDSSQLPRQR